MSRKTLSIDVVSDPVCPWCYVGKRRLESAIAQLPELDINVRWHPFQLNPDMPREGRNRQQYYAEKFGEERAEMMLSGLKDTGADEGITFGRDPAAMAPNTLSAHVLMRWASVDENVDANALAEKIFSAHHEACENIGDHQVLTRIAGEVGMDEQDVAEQLAAGADEAAVQESIEHSVQLGVSGVPFFVVNGKYGISGAQPPDSLVSAFKQIAAESDSTTGSAD
jgi:predicted DsbA family dithiol-disulfide isomerase